MNKTLYDEAVADAQRLRELAEETAKNKVIDAVMPQIRDLVNKRILGENIEDFSEEENQPYEEEMSFDSVVSLPSETEASDTSNDIEVEISAQGDVHVNLSQESDDNEDLVLDDRMSEALRQLIKGETSPTISPLHEKIDSLESQVRRLSELKSVVNYSDLTASQRKRINVSFLYCVREAIKLRAEVIITECKTQERLERRLTEIIKEIKNMSKSNRRNIFDFLFEAGDEKQGELEEAELSLELTDDEQEELVGADDTAAIEDALESILGDLEVSMETGADDEEASGEEELEEPAAEDSAAEEASEDLDLEEGEKVDEMDMEEVYEIDENMLRKELTRMMTEDAEDAADQFGGGEALGDVLLDIDEEDLINVLADEIGNTDVPATEPMVAVENRRTSRSTLSRKLAKTTEQLKEYKQAVSNLKGQLVEMNLFNAKLLYANKLMQNKNLTMKQQKAIVEALDNAKTLREAKLLFKSLTESLNRKSSKKLTEGSLRTLGSSSKSTRSAQPASSGVEVDRWAVLAGLYGND
jgi:hypothetical protein